MGLHRSHQRCLATGAASALATASRTAKIRITHLHQARPVQLLAAREHHLHQFVHHVLSGVVGNAQLPMQLHGPERPFLGNLDRNLQNSFPIQYIELVIKVCYSVPRFPISIQIARRIRLIDRRYLVKHVQTK